MSAEAIRIIEPQVLITSHTGLVPERNVVIADTSVAAAEVLPPAMRIPRRLRVLRGNPFVTPEQAPFLLPELPLATGRITDNGQPEPETDGERSVSRPTTRRNVPTDPEFRPFNGFAPDVTVSRDDTDVLRIPETPLDQMAGYKAFGAQGGYQPYYNLGNRGTGNPQALHEGEIITEVPSHQIEIYNKPLD